MPCGLDGCTSKVFCVDQETLAHVQYVNLTCLECSHKRQVSLSDFELMVYFRRRLLLDSIFHGGEWTEEAVIKIMTWCEFAGDENWPHQEITFSKTSGGGKK